ncbi:Leo1-like protein-domain-containing protein [Myxozyma melibiosi]|uniref:Leo1-like protein-domain-containing protein n=1 Tax=Myxozyma melibiosi TaxID=54550 RepID=A0ABR1FA31_9ASCO
MEEVEMQEMEITMPRYLSSHKVPKETAIARMPNFLNIDPVAFDADTYLETAENIEKAKGEGTDESRRQLREEVQNMIRWRYVKDEQGNNKIQSNARIIRWSNGSYSLKLGGEIFDIQETPVNDTYLAVSHNEQEIVQFHNKISKILNMTPSSTTSQTHLRMSNALARGQVKTRYINDIVTIEDPEKVKREAEKAEENKIRARKKLENKRAALESRSNYDRELGAGVGRGAGGGAGGRGSRYDADDDGMGYGNSADYEKDDFVVSDDDEDEEEERAERLRKLKKAGADKYKKRRKGSDDDDEDEEEEEEEEDEDDLLDDDDDDLEIPSQRRDLKRRRDYSDDDDEE